MKRILFLLLTAGSALSVSAQTSVQMAGHRHLVDTTRPMPYWAPDSILSAWVIDVNVLGGVMNMDLTTKNTVGNYPDGVNLNAGNLKFTNGWSVGGDVQVGYFFGKKRHWGVGTGFQYLYQGGDVTLDNYHVEYKATDIRGDVYRQVISSNGKVAETMKSENFNIPLVLKYKNRFNRRLGFTADAGLVFNVKNVNYYKTKASFDYEAIYRYSNESGFVYDNSPVPQPGDVLYTKEQIGRTLTAGTVAEYFEKLRTQGGYNVGLNQKARVDNGSNSYKATIGFILQPSLNVFLSDDVALNFGLYYQYQGYTNEVKSGYRLTNGVGDYNSSLNTVSSSATQSYGLNVGARFFIGHKAPSVRDEDVYDPSNCGASDGKIAINGFRSNKVVTVNYYKNGVAQKEEIDTTNDNGTVTLDSLSSGAYDTIVVKMRKRTATAIPATLMDPPMTITYESSTHPTAFDKCDGSLTLIVGPHTGSAVTVTYKVDGNSKTYSGNVSNNRIVINGLCGGNYTNITASIGNCTATATDVTLVTPPAPPPPPPPAPVTPAITVSTPILFELNKTVIREDSHPVIDLAVEKLNADKNAIVEVNGYTDATGRPAYNKALSIRRANAVKKELMHMGISAKRIKIVGHGAADPAADNETAEGRAKNRRAVMHLNIGE